MVKTNKQKSKITHKILFLSEYETMYTLDFQRESRRNNNP